MWWSKVAVVILLEILLVHVTRILHLLKNASIAHEASHSLISKNVIHEATHSLSSKNIIEYILREEILLILKTVSHERPLIEMMLMLLKWVLGLLLLLSSLLLSIVHLLLTSSLFLAFSFLSLLVRFLFLRVYSSLIIYWRTWFVTVWINISKVLPSSYIWRSLTFFLFHRSLLKSRLLILTLQICRVWLWMCRLLGFTDKFNEIAVTLWAFRISKIYHLLLLIPTFMTFIPPASHAVWLSGFSWKLSL